MACGLVPGDPPVSGGASLFYQRMIVALVAQCDHDHLKSFCKGEAGFWTRFCRSDVMLFRIRLSWSLFAGPLQPLAKKIKSSPQRQVL